MREKLIKLLENSHSPYSHFRVAAILVCKDGREFNGVKELYVMCDNKKIGKPCFICRQVFTEFFEKDMLATCMNPDGETIVKTVSELCPYPFDSEDLK